MRQRIGPDLPILRNLDNLSFLSASAEALRARALDCLQTGTENGPFIFCNAGGDIPIRAPLENIHALREAAEQHTASPPPDVLWVVCNVLSNEVRELHRQGLISGELLELDSMLHMDPPELERTLRAIIDEQTRPIVLVYGDCCPAMLQLAERPGVVRVSAPNCIQLLTGKAYFKELMHREAFVLLPEWAPRWKTIIEQELGLKGDVARDLFRENRKELVYLDTGITPVPYTEINACAATTGLPAHIEKTGLSHLRKALQSAHNMLTSL